MRKASRSPVVIVGALLAVAVFLAAGLPLAEFGWTTVMAEYTPAPYLACGGTITMQVRFKANTVVYANVDLTRSLLTLRVRAGHHSYAYLCPGYLKARARSWKIVLFSGREGFIRPNAGEVLPLHYYDIQKN